VGGPSRPAIPLGRQREWGLAWLWMTLAAQPRRANRRWDSAVYVVSAAVAIGGSILPWTTVSASFLDPVYKAGIDGDGRLTLVLGVVLLGLGVLSFLPWSAVRRVVPVLVLVVATGITVVTLVNLAGVRSAAGPLTPEARVLVDTQAGIGLWLTLVAGVAAMCVGVVSLLPSTSARA
jgi:hypothetical protein